MPGPRPRPAETPTPAHPYMYGWGEAIRHGQTLQLSDEFARWGVPHCWLCGRFMRRLRGRQLFECSRCDVMYWPEELALGIPPFDPHQHIDHSREHVPSPA